VGGVRAPYKPLLLWLLGRFNGASAVAHEEAEEPLSRLINGSVRRCVPLRSEYGPLCIGAAARRVEPGRVTA
jgi:hypothetical protein